MIGTIRWQTQLLVFGYFAEILRRSPVFILFCGYRRRRQYVTTGSVTSMSRLQVFRLFLFRSRCSSPPGQ